MSKLNIEKINKIHFIGVGGIGMSALARHLKSEKKSVSGSDRELSDITKQLDKDGIQVFGEQVASNITKDIELVVYTEAVNKDTEGFLELEAAKKLKIPTINYFEALGLAMNPYYLIVVAGTHGKTTTTAMITDIFENAEKDPTAIIGSLRASTKSNYRAGKSKYAIVEACEYKRDFLHLKPDILLITNLEFDHTDFYKDMEDVQSAFHTLAKQVNEGGVVIANVSDANVAPVLQDLDVPVVNYLDVLDLDLQMKQPGFHNRLNAAAAIAVARQEGLDMEKAKEALMNFAGTWRRFEYRGKFSGAPVYNDYAHHPTAVRATIGATRELYPESRVFIVFQPHMYTRTKSLFDEFAKAVGLADRVLFLPIYAAREKNQSGVSSRELSVKSLEFTPNSTYADSFAAAEKVLRKEVKKDDVVVFMGAGDITELVDSLVK